MLRKVVHTLRWIAAIGAGLFTIGLSFGLWTVGDFSPTWTFLMGYGACAIVKSIPTQAPGSGAGGER